MQLSSSSWFLSRKNGLLESGSLARIRSAIDLLSCSLIVPGAQAVVVLGDSVQTGLDSRLGLISFRYTREVYAVKYMVLRGENVDLGSRNE